MTQGTIALGASSEHIIVGTVATEPYVIRIPKKDRKSPNISALFALVETTLRSDGLQLSKRYVSDDDIYILASIPSGYTQEKLGVLVETMKKISPNVTLFPASALNQYVKNLDKLEHYEPHIALSEKTLHGWKGKKWDNARQP